MAKADKKFFLILDIDKVLATDEPSGHAAMNRLGTEAQTGKELPQ
jgi:hypothetical protein